MSQNLFMEIIGTAKDAHERYPIRFDYSEGGKAFFNGCRVEATVKLSNGQEIIKRMDVRAFGEIAESLAHIQDGADIHVKGEFGQQKGNDGKYYPIVTITEVISA